jgi:hypothetical protein
VVLFDNRDCPRLPLGQSTKLLRTIRPDLEDCPQELLKLAKSLVSQVVLPLWGVLRPVPRVGGSVVTTRLWQARVGILSCEFGA